MSRRLCMHGLDLLLLLLPALWQLEVPHLIQTNSFFKPLLAP